MRAWVLVCASLAAGVQAAPPAGSGDFLGSWRIAGSAPAPWVRDGEGQYPPDIARLTGKMVIFSRRSIAAPEPLGCRGPHYVVREYPPDMLFQGTLTDPPRQAKTLGYSGSTIRTLETGCEGAIDFHFLDARTALFALNNRIYRIERTGK